MDLFVSKFVPKTDTQIQPQIALSLLEYSHTQKIRILYQAICVSIPEKKHFCYAIRIRILGKQVLRTTTVNFKIIFKHQINFANLYDIVIINKALLLVLTNRIRYYLIPKMKKYIKINKFPNV